MIVNGLTNGGKTVLDVKPRQGQTTRTSRWECEAGSGALNRTWMNEKVSNESTLQQSSELDAIFVSRSWDVLTKGSNMSICVDQSGKTDNPGEE